MRLFRCAPLGSTRPRMGGKTSDVRQESKLRLRNPLSMSIGSRDVEKDRSVAKCGMSAFRFRSREEASGWQPWHVFGLHATWRP